MSGWPPVWCCNEPGTFAYHTATVRWPRILRQLLVDNLLTLTSHDAEDVRILISELESDGSSPLSLLSSHSSKEEEDAARDISLWDEYIRPFVGLSGETRRGFSLRFISIVASCRPFASSSHRETLFECRRIRLSRDSQPQRDRD